MQQPWATLIAIGAKRVETRSWFTSYRGPLAIHAARTVGFTDLHLGPWRWQHFGSHGGCLSREEPRTILYPSLGAVVAMCQLLDVVPITAQPTGEVSVAPDEDGNIRLWQRFEVNAGGGGWVGEAAWSSEREDGWTAPNEAAFGDFTPGRYAWLLADVMPLDPSIPAKGRQGLWTWDEYPGGAT